MPQTGLLFLGFVALYFGAEWLVRGASRLASALGVRPLVIGITVVGLGTSTPELVVSAVAAARGEPDTALGNVLGSTIANGGLILALVTLLSPMKCQLRLLKREGPIMIGVAIVCWAVAWTGAYERWQGALMLAGLGLFIFFTLRWAREEPPVIEDEFEQYESEHRLLAQGQLARQFGWIVAGLAALAVGGHLLATSAVALAQRFGIPDIVIAATLVAVGTSLPELATSLVAALRRQADIAVGNIIGSNIFNLLGVLGLSAAIHPIPVTPAVRNFEFLWMLAFVAGTALVLRTGHRISRGEGALLLAAYLVFLILLFS